MTSQPCAKRVVAIEAEHLAILLRFAERACDHGLNGLDGTDPIEVADLRRRLQRAKYEARLALQPVSTLSRFVVRCRRCGRWMVPIRIHMNPEITEWECRGVSEHDSLDGREADE